MATDKEKGGLFNKLYAAKEEFLTDMRKPGIRRNVKRKLGAAYDDAEQKKQTALAEIEKIRQSNNFQDYNINAILEQKNIIATAEQLQGFVQEEYKILFDEEMKVEED